MMNRCPGSLAGTPTLKIKKCPECGGEVEVFSNDVSVKCDCGFTVYNDVESCIQWCKYAKPCGGEELYKKLKRVRIAFIGVENTVRSVLAEALAKELNTSPKLGFVSAGVNPAGAADPVTVELLAQENIAWRGKPKDVARVGLADIFVLMEHDLEIPSELSERAKVLKWDIAKPAGNNVEEYKKVAAVIRNKVAELIKEVDQDGQS